MSEATVAPDIVWTCSVCDKPVADGDGYIAIGIDDVNRAERERQEWEDANPTATTLSELRTYPTAQWLVFHSGCDPGPERGPHRIDVSQIRSAWAALAWTAHLMHEPWLSVTDWRLLIERVAEAHGASAES